MSLIKKQSMTDKNLAAHQRNARQSRGAATAEGKERSRAANLRHGFYAQGREEALRALGEDPAALATLIESTHEEWQPASDFQARIAERMARLWWRMERAERIQESLVARQRQQDEKRRQKAALKLRFKWIPQIDLLELLEEFPADPRFYTPRGYFQLFSQAFGEKVDDGEKEILMLMHQLRKPEGLDAGPSGARPERTGEEAADSPPNAILSEEGSRTSIPLLNKEEGGVVAQASLLDPSLGSGVPSPGPEGGVVAAEDPEEDVYLRELAEMDEDDDDDCSIPWPEIPVAQGAERDDLRQEMRDLAKDLLVIVHNTLDPQLEEQERTLSRIDQDEVQAAPHRHAELMRREEESCFRQFMRLGNFLVKIQDRAEKHAENEGPPGYVGENTLREQPVTMTNCPDPAADSAEGARQTVRSPRSEVRSAESEVPSLKPEVGDGRPAEGTRSVAPQMAGSPRSKVRSEGTTEIANVIPLSRMPDSGFRMPDKSRSAVRRPK